MVFIDEKITREEYTLDWSQSKVFLVVLVLGFGSWSLTLIWRLQALLTSLVNWLVLRFWFSKAWCCRKTSVGPYRWFAANHASKLSWLLYGCYYVSDWDILWTNCYKMYFHPWSFVVPANGMAGPAEQPWCKGKR